MHRAEDDPPTAYTVSRRDFLGAASGVLVVSFGALAPGRAQGPFGTRASHIDPSQLDSWLAVSADGSVTAYTGKCELGQGMHTAQVQLVAEELGVGVDRVRLVMCDTDVCPDQGTTSGSQSTPTNFNEQNLALAAATAREALVRLAAARLGVPADRLVAEAGAVHVATDASRRVTYADLVAGRKFTMPLDRRARRKLPATWTVLGAPVRRLDLPDLVTGRLNSCTRSGFLECFTAPLSGRRRSAQRSCAWTSDLSVACRES